MIWAALISTLLSVGLHFYLTLQHFQLKLGLSEEPSACHINATFNCDAVAISSASEIFGIPIAIFGAWTNLVLAILILIGALRLAQDNVRIKRYSLLGALFVVMVSIVMASISSLVLKTYCLYCMGAYALSIVTLALLWFTKESTDETSLIPNIGSDLIDLFGAHKWVLILALMIPGGSWLTEAVIAQNYGLGKLTAAIEESLQNWQSAPQQTFNSEQGLIYEKSANSKMTIVEFADFLCPHCKMAYPSVDAFAASRPDVIGFATLSTSD